MLRRTSLSSWCTNLFLSNEVIRWHCHSTFLVDQRYIVNYCLNIKANKLFVIHLLLNYFGFDVMSPYAFSSHHWQIELYICKPHYWEKKKAIKKKRTNSFRCIDLRKGRSFFFFFNEMTNKINALYIGFV